MTTELIDTHAHLTFDDFKDVDGVITRAKHAGVTTIFCVGTDPDGCREVATLSQRYAGVWCICGVHPHRADDIGDLDGLRAVLPGEKLVAIGETGLDYHYDFACKSSQRRLLEQHFALAGSLNLPVCVHCREAFDDIVDSIGSAGTGLRGVVHCFTGDRSDARRVLELGWSISFSGIMTFKRSDELRRVARDIPLERVLVETDCPYLSPEPVRKYLPNEPANVRYVAEALAEVRGMALDALVEQLWRNVTDLFGPGIRGEQVNE